MSDEYLEPYQACPLYVTNTLSMAPLLMFDMVLNTLLSLILNNVRHFSLAKQYDANKTPKSIRKLQNLTELRTSRKYLNSLGFWGKVKYVKKPNTPKILILGILRKWSVKTESE